MSTPLDQRQRRQRFIAEGVKKTTYIAIPSRTEIELSGVITRRRDARRQRRSHSIQHVSVADPVVQESLQSIAGPSRVRDSRRRGETHRRSETRFPSANEIHAGSGLLERPGQAPKFAATTEGDSGSADRVHSLEGSNDRRGPLQEQGTEGAPQENRPLATAQLQASMPWEPFGSLENSHRASNATSSTQRDIRHKQRHLLPVMPPVPPSESIGACWVGGPTCGMVLPVKPDSVTMVSMNTATTLGWSWDSADENKKILEIPIPHIRNIACSAGIVQPTHFVRNLRIPLGRSAHKFVNAFIFPLPADESGSLATPENIYAHEHKEISLGWDTFREIEPCLEVHVVAAPGPG